MPRVAKMTDETKETEVTEVAGDQTAILEVPLSEPPGGDPFIVHLNINLTPRQGLILRRIARAYDSRQATLKNGERVVREGAAIRKMIEDIEDAIK